MQSFWNLADQYWYSQNDAVKIGISIGTAVAFAYFGLRYLAQRSQNTNIFNNLQVLQWSQMGQYFNWNTHAIFYIEHINNNAPSNNDLLIVHGYPTYSFDFKQVIKHLNALNKFSRIIIYDQIGHGLSDKPSNDKFYYSVHKQVDLLQSFIKHINYKQFHIMAHDLGDTIIQEYMARYIDNINKNEVNIKSICFLNGGLLPKEHRPLLIQKLSINPLFKPIIIQLFNKHAFKRSITKTWGKRIELSDDIIDSMWIGMTHKNGVGPLVNILRYVEERKQYSNRWVGTLVKCNELNIPMLLINGVLDPISGGHLADKFEQIVANAKVVRLKDVGHWPNIEAPKDVCECYAKFVVEL